MIPINSTYSLRRARHIIVFLSAIAMVAAMTVMCEDVHQRAGKQQDEWQAPEDMRAVFVFVHDWLYRIHARWFRISLEAFNAINYAGVAAYKIGIILFVIVPLIALLVSGSK